MERPGHGKEGWRGGWSLLLDMDGPVKHVAFYSTKYTLFVCSKQATPLHYPTAMNRQAPRLPFLLGTCTLQHTSGTLPPYAMAMTEGGRMKLR